MNPEPLSTQPLTPGEQAVMSWAEAASRLAAGGTFWLSTTHADGRPHVRPLLAVWCDDALHFVAGPGTHKARNLARDPRCVITTISGGMHLVVEGTAERVTEETALQRVAKVYANKYSWPVEVRGGAFYGDGAPTAGPPPYEIYRMIPAVIFGFGEEESMPSTRWQFATDKGA